MSANRLQTALLPLLGFTGVVAFQAQSSVARVPRFSPLQSTELASSYLNSLGQPAQPQAAVPAVASAFAPPPEEASTPAAALSYAPIDYFALDKLVSKGPRTADWGTPQDASRKLGSDGMLSVGSWFCSEGGWPSPNPKAHTETFYVLTGHGCLTDSDGCRHYFGPGDHVIIPKGHTGRWDVNTDMHKVWAVNAHERVEEKGPVVRVQVDHYHTYGKVGGQGSPLYGNTDAGNTHTFYNVGPTQIGSWTCSPGSFQASNTKSTFFHVLEGVVFLTDTSGSACRCVPGDTAMLPAGWCGHVDVTETAKALFTTAD